MANDSTQSIRLAGTLCTVAGLAACAILPPGTTGATAPDVTWLTMEGGATAPAVAGKVLVKFKSGSRSVQGLRMTQAIAGLQNTAIYTVPAGSTVSETVAKLRSDPNVSYAEPDYLYHAYGYRTQATVNDPMFNQLWGIQKIHAPEAWDTTTGTPNVVVAVVDTGVDYNHEDLQGQVTKGPNLASGTSDPMDDQGHGSHVAGTIAASGNNGVGVVGIAYHTKVLAIKVLGSDGSGDTATIAQGILKANELGAKVINLSLGGPQASQTLKDAVDQVTAKGSLCVVAAGNDGNTNTDYPAGYPNALAVGATDQNDSRASFSNYGSYVSIAAPGVGILSSTGGSYKQESGTSMASPHVAGAAALLLAKNPNLTPQQLKDALTSSGDPASGFENPALKRLNVAKALAAVAGTAPTPTPAPPTPAPAAPAPNPPALTSPTGLKALAASTTQVQLNWNPSSGAVTGYRVFRDGQPIGTATAPPYLDSGLTPGANYAYTVAAADAAGNTSAQSAPANIQMPSSNGELTISGVVLKGLTGTSATIGWKTNNAASSRIDYTTRQLYFSGLWLNATGSDLTTTHALTLNQLAPGGIYYLKVTSVDATGHRITAGLYGLKTPLN